MKQEAHGLLLIQFNFLRITILSAWVLVLRQIVTVNSAFIRYVMEVFKLISRLSPRVSLKGVGLFILLGSFSLSYVCLSAQIRVLRRIRRLYRRAGATQRTRYVGSTVPRLLQSEITFLQERLEQNTFAQVTTRNVLQTYKGRGRSR